MVADRIQERHAPCALAALISSVLLAAAPTAGAMRSASSPAFRHWQKLAEGAAVAISADGRTVVVGDRTADPCPTVPCRGKGAIFVRAGKAWTRAATLAPADRAPGFGTSVAISADGRVVVVGAHQSWDEEIAPAVYVFMRSGDAWRLAQTMLSSRSESRFGHSVAVSGNGATIVVGDEPRSSRDVGVAHVYARAGAVWTESAALRDPSGSFTFGDTVAVSSDGRTILVLSADTGFVFAWAGGGWLLEGSLVPAGDNAFLTTAALSPEGRVAVLTDDDVSGSVSGPGRAYVFVKAGSTWRKAQTIVERGRPRDWNGFGEGVAASRDGRTLLIGAPLTDVGRRLYPLERGAVHVFSRGGDNVWRCTQVLGTDRALFDFGGTVAVTPDGARLVAGARPAFVVSR